MKIYLLLFLCVVTLTCYSQPPITFKIKNGAVVCSQQDLTNLQLPVEMSFTKDFNKEQLVLVDETDGQAFNGTQILGEGELAFSNSQPDVIYTLSAGRKTEPGGHTIPSNKIKLTVKGENFSMTLTEAKDNKNGGQEAEEYKAGYIYYDAMALTDSKVSLETKGLILKAYEVDLNSSDKNPFLKLALADLYNKIIAKNGAQGLDVGASLSNLNSGSVVNYAVAGFSRFLAERAKEEINEAFFSKMKDQLNAYPELTTVFPKTSAFLNIIETYSYSSVLQVLKEAFETDMQNLPENLYQLKSLNENNCVLPIIKDSKREGCKERLKKLSEYFKSRDGLWVALGMYVIKESAQSSNPAELLKSIVESGEFASLQEFTKPKKEQADSNQEYLLDYNISSVIELSNLLSQSLLSKEENQIWINAKELNGLVGNEKGLEVYFGLLLANEIIKAANDKKQIYFIRKSDGKGVSFGEALFESGNHYGNTKPQLKSLIKNIHTVFNSSNNAVIKMIAATDKSVDADATSLYNYYRTFTATLKPIVNNPFFEPVIGSENLAKFNEIETVLSSSVDLVYHISSKKYSAAVFDAVALLKTKKPAFEKEVAKPFVKYGTLISTIATAQSSDEVKKALEASVLPVGSYSIKRKSKFSMSINSYVGVYYSYNNNKDYLPTLGLSAPVGINMSWGSKEDGKLGSVSLNVQVIDVGALVNYYLIKGDSAKIPNEFNVRLSNILAPGFNVAYNIPKTPLSVAWGGQYIPTLYHYEQITGTTKMELKPVHDFRWQLSVLIDIPLFNLKVLDFDK